MNFGPNLGAAQRRVAVVYEVANATVPLWVIQMFLSQRTATILKSIQSKNLQLAHIHVVQIFTWICALANKAGVSLEKNLRQHFPGICPACDESICLCAGGGKLEERVSQERLHKLEQGLPEVNLQSMLFNIYPHNELLDSTNHLVAEVAELGQAIAQAELAGSIASAGERSGFLLELADVTAHSCAVASLLNLNIADGVLDYLSNGCPVCGHYACDCKLGHVDLKKVGTQILKAVPER